MKKFLLFFMVFFVAVISVAAQTNTAQENWTTTGGQDYLHLINPNGGNVLGWIDSTGTLHGNLLPTSIGGTVTVVGAGSLTSTALVTGGGTTLLQTPSSTSTLDASGNLTIPGTLVAPVMQGTVDASANLVLGMSLVRGADETGAGGATSQGGNMIVRGGNNAATNAASAAGILELVPGLSTGSTQGLQGLLAITENYIKGGGTSTLWNLQCIVTTTAMTVNDCGASPTVPTVGIAASVNSNTVQVHILSSQSPVNSSNAATVGHTVCAGSTAGKVSDSGGTSPCASGQGYTIGEVIAVSGVYNFPITCVVTLSTTLPLIQINRVQGVGVGGIQGTLGVTNGGTGTGTVGSAGMVPNTPNTTSSAWTVTPTLGVAGTSNGTLTLASSTATGSVTLTPASAASAFTVTVPAATGQLGVTPNLAVSPTAPTITTHFNTSGDSVSANNGSIAFTITVGSGAGTTTGVIGLPTASTGWNCFAANMNRAAIILQSASSTTSATLTNYAQTAGVTATNWSNGDVLHVSCFAY
jgi:hypothetical protein